jgi:hypothetical protein
MATARFQTLDQILPGQTVDLEQVRWCPGVPACLYDDRIFSDGTVTRTTEGRLEYRVAISLGIGSYHNRRRISRYGDSALKLVEVLKQCRAHRIEVTEIVYLPVGQSIPSWEWKENHQPVCGETAQRVVSRETLRGVKLRDLVYVVGPETTLSGVLLDIWVVRKFWDQGVIVSSLVEPTKFKMRALKWEQLEALLPMVVVTGLPARGLKEPTAQLLTEDGMTIKIDKYRLKSSTLPVLSPVIEAIPLN